MSSVLENPYHIPPLLAKFYEGTSEAYKMVGGRPLNSEHEILNSLRVCLAANPELHFEEVTTTTTPDRKWRIISAMQKAIRRSDEELARKAGNAVRLLDDAYFWRRLVVIALEDIGVADPVLCSWVLAATTTKSYRAMLGEKALAMFLLTLMARAVKDRTTCDLTCLASYLPLTNEFNAYLPYDYLGSLNTPLGKGWGMAGVLKKAVSALLISGTNRTEITNLPKTYNDRSDFEDWVHSTEVPFVVKYLALRGRVVERYGLWATVITAYEVVSLSESFSDVVTPMESPIIMNVLSCTYDQYTQEGKRAIAYFAKACDPLREFLATRPEFNPFRATASMIFLVEGGYLTRQMLFDGVEDFRHYAILSDMVGSGISTIEDAQQLSTLVLDNLEGLHHARRRILGLVPGR